MVQDLSDASDVVLPDEIGQFSSHLAGVLFEDPARALSPQEEVFVQRFEALVMRVSKARLAFLARRIDKILVESLSGSGVLRVARCIEGRAPEVIALMPKLGLYQNHLMRSSEVADAFSFTSLRRLVDAIREESKRV